MSRYSPIGRTRPSRRKFSSEGVGVNFAEKWTWSLGVTTQSENINTCNVFRIINELWKFFRRKQRRQFMAKIEVVRKI